ncbi:MAG: hypothetical protein AAGF11_05550 [Myxococcota bacterium]
MNDASSIPASCTGDDHCIVFDIAMCGADVGLDIIEDLLRHLASEQFRCCAIESYDAYLWGGRKAKGGVPPDDFGYRRRGNEYLTI